MVHHSSGLEQLVHILNKEALYETCILYYFILYFLAGDVGLTAGRRRLNVGLIAGGCRVDSGWTSVGCRLYLGWASARRRLYLGLIAGRRRLYLTSG